MLTNTSQKIVSFESAEPKPINLAVTAGLQPQDATSAAFSEDGKQLAIAFCNKAPNAHSPVLVHWNVESDAPPVGKVFAFREANPKFNEKPADFLPLMHGLDDSGRTILHKEKGTDMIFRWSNLVTDSAADKGRVFQHLELRGHTDAVTQTTVLTHCDQRLLVTATAKGDIKLWEVSKGREVARLVLNAGVPFSLRHRPDQDRLEVLSLAEGKIVVLTRFDMNAVRFFR